MFLVKHSKLSYKWTSRAQWAADKTNSSLINEPPHMNVMRFSSLNLPKPTWAMCGNSVRSALEPPMINGISYSWHCDTCCVPGWTGNVGSPSVCSANFEYSLHSVEESSDGYWYKLLFWLIFPWILLDLARSPIEASAMQHTCNKITIKKWRENAMMKIPLDFPITKFLIVDWSIFSLIWALNTKSIMNLTAVRDLLFSPCYLHFRQISRQSYLGFMEILLFPFFFAFTEPRTRQVRGSESKFFRGR